MGVRARAARCPGPPLLSYRAAPKLGSGQPKPTPTAGGTEGKMGEAIRKSAAPLRRPAPQEAPKGTPGERESSLGAFPQVRLRRNRSAGWVRRLVAENQTGRAHV